MTLRALRQSILALLPTAGLLVGCTAGTLTNDLPGAPPPAAHHAQIMPVHRSRAGLSSYASASSSSGTPHLDYQGGPVISNVKVVVLYWGQSDDASLDGFYKDITQSAYFDWLKEYDTPSQNIGRGSFLEAVVDPSPPSATTLDDTNVQAEIGRLIDAGTLPAPDGNIIYMVHFAPGLNITMQGMQSCQDFCGYHSSFTHGSQVAYYAVLPDLGGACAGGCGASDLFGNTTSVASHELIEAVTDCQVGSNTAWYDNTNGEIGDICNAKQASVDGYTVQLEWSNKNDNCIATDPGSTPAPPPPSGCSTGLTSCGGTCVDTSSDSANCGGCGNACTGGATCVSGACQTPSTGGGGGGTGGASCVGMGTADYCGNDGVGGDPGTLYHCSGDAIVGTQPCAYGCVNGGAYANDYCAAAPSGSGGGGGTTPGASCAGLPDGDYCGSDSVGGDPGTLYSCSGGVVVGTSACAYGCTTAPAGYDDYCN